jgi:hypothetical protein
MIIIRLSLKQVKICVHSLLAPDMSLSSLPLPEAKFIARKLLDLKAQTIFKSVVVEDFIQKAIQIEVHIISTIDPNFQSQILPHINQYI